MTQPETMRLKFATRARWRLNRRVPRNFRTKLPLHRALFHKRLRTMCADLVVKALDTELEA